MTALLRFLLTQTRVNFAQTTRYIVGGVAMLRAVPSISTVLLLVTTPLQANLIENGGFEEPALPSGTFEVFTVLPGGWFTISGPGIEVQNNVDGAPFEGDQHVELDSFFNSVMGQSVPTISGYNYLVTFAYSPRPLIPASSTGIEVRWDGSVLGSFSSDGGVVTSWKTFEFLVPASSTSTLLEFAAIGTSDALGGYIDAVNVRLIPEPASNYTLSLAAALATALCRGRRRRG